MSPGDSLSRQATAYLARREFVLQISPAGVKLTDLLSLGLARRKPDAGPDAIAFEYNICTVL
ncbi:hypothetical protein A2U01_0070200, partial [Trifolium medium]|nr:hypothetical protein [Trifolium medium]